MPASRIAFRIVLIAGIYVPAAAARAEEPGLEPGMWVVAKSPDLALRDGGKLIPLASPFNFCRVERVEGDRVRLYAAGREGDARASDIVRVEQAEAYFSDQMKQNPRAVYSLLMRCAVRAEIQHDLVNALADCEAAIRIGPKNPWSYVARGEIKAQRSGWT
jgi:hypothetical protein